MVVFECDPGEAPGALLGCCSGALCPDGYKWRALLLIFVFRSKFAANENEYTTHVRMLLRICVWPVCDQGDLGAGNTSLG